MMSTVGIFRFEIGKNNVERFSDLKSDNWPIEKGTTQ
jgi:hypothetical protein|nr:MAG TPA: hypothetical protein [Caudoviricetes sp.]